MTIITSIALASLPSPHIVLFAAGITFLNGCHRSVTFTFSLGEGDESLSNGRCSWRSSVKSEESIRDGSWALMFHNNKPYDGM